TRVRIRAPAVRHNFRSQERRGYARGFLSRQRRPEGRGLSTRGPGAEDVLRQPRLDYTTQESGCQSGLGHPQPLKCALYCCSCIGWPEQLCYNLRHAHPNGRPSRNTYASTYEWGCGSEEAFGLLAGGRRRDRACLYGWWLVFRIPL